MVAKMSLAADIVFWLMLAAMAFLVVATRKTNSKPYWLLVIPSMAQQWTRFRGPNGSGGSDATTILPYQVASRLSLHRGINQRGLASLF